MFFAITLLALFAVSAIDAQTCEPSTHPCENGYSIVTDAGNFCFVFSGEKKFKDLFKGDVGPCQVSISNTGKFDPAPFSAEPFQSCIIVTDDGELVSFDLSDDAGAITTTTPFITKPPLSTTKPPLTTTADPTTTPPITTPSDPITTAPVTAPPDPTTTTPPITTPPDPITTAPVTAPPDPTTTTPPITTPPDPTTLPPDTTTTATRKRIVAKTPRSITFDKCDSLVFDDDTSDARKRQPVVFSGSASSSASFGVLASGANGDPHLVGAHGEHFDFYGEPGAVYTLFSTPQFVLNMQLWDKGPDDRYIERLGLRFRNATHTFSTAAFHPTQFEHKLNRELAPVGGRAHLSPNRIELELCEGHVVEIVHRVAKAQANRGGDIYHLDVAVTVPGCHDAYGGALGQTYQCRYSQGERFVWSRKLEHAYRVKSLLAKAGAFTPDAPCHDAREFAGQSPMSGRSGKQQQS